MKEPAAQEKQNKGVGGGKGVKAQGESKKLKKMSSIKEKKINIPRIFGTRICTLSKNVGTETGLLKDIFSIFS